MKRITYDSNADRIVLHTHYKDKQAAGGLPGSRWRPTAKAWSVPATPAVWKRVRETWPDEAREARFSDEELGKIQWRCESRKEAQTLKKAPPKLPNYEYYTDPWQHQIPATEFACRMDRCLLHCRMGAGKTKIALDVARNRGHKQILVICPKNAILVWRDEIKKHTKDGEWRFLGLKGDNSTTVADRNDTLQRALLSRVSFIAAINYEAIWRDDIRDLLLNPEHLDQWPLLVLDESHHVKNSSTNQGKMAQKIPAEQILALTGTPMPHSPLDIFGQYKVLDLGIYGTSFGRFKAKYAKLQPVPGKPNATMVKGFKNQDELTAQMSRLCYHVGEEALDLPELQVIDRTCQLSSKARKHYDELETALITQVEDGTVTVKNALTKLLRLQQVSAGFVKTEDDEIRRIGSAKQKLLEEILEDIGPDEDIEQRVKRLDHEARYNDEHHVEPVVVFCRFRQDLNRIREVAEKLDRSVGEISGRQRDYERWQDGEVDVLAAQVQAASEGIDLTRSRYAVYYTLGYSLGQYRQALARLHRPGQDSKVTVFRLLAEGTVDNRIRRALDRRAEVVREIIEGIREAEHE